MKTQNVLIGKIMAPSDLGLMVRKRRKAQRLTQADLAGIANVGNRFIVELERGKTTLQIGKVLEILTWLGITLVATEKTDE